MLRHLGPWDWESYSKEESFLQKPFLLVCADSFLLDLFLGHFVQPRLGSFSLLGASDVSQAWIENKKNQEHQLDLFSQKENYLIPYSSKYSKDFYTLNKDFIILTATQIPSNSKDFPWDIVFIPEISTSQYKKFFFLLAKWKNISIDFQKYDNWNFLENLYSYTTYDLSIILEESQYPDFQVSQDLFIQKDIPKQFWNKNFSYCFAQLTKILHTDKMKDEEGRREKLRTVLNSIKYYGLNRWEEGNLSHWNHSDFLKAIMQIGEWEMDFRGFYSGTPWSTHSIDASFLKTHKKENLSKSLL